MQNALEIDGGPDGTCVAGLKSVLEAVSASCAKYVKHMANAPPIGNTKLDRERQKLCNFEIVSSININILRRKICLVEHDG